MKSRMLVGVAVLAILSGVGVYASVGTHVAGPRQWAIVNFADPIEVQGNLLMGRYLIVHDDARMERGEPCTTIYRFDERKGPQEAAVSFMCKPATRTVCANTTLSVRSDTQTGIRRLLEYQFAGDAEVHRIPSR